MGSTTNRFNITELVSIVAIRTLLPFLVYIPSFRVLSVLPCKMNLKKVSKHKIACIVRLGEDVCGITAQFLLRHPTCFVWLGSKLVVTETFLSQPNVKTSFSSPSNSYIVFSGEFNTCLRSTRSASFHTFIVYNDLFNTLQKTGAVLKVLYLLLKLFRILFLEYIQHIDEKKKSCF